MIEPIIKLEAHYRRLLRFYPPDYRAGRGDELLETLLACARPGQSRPHPREAAILILEGLRTRSGAGLGIRRADTWLGGLYLAVVFLLVNDAYDAITTSVMAWGDYHAFIRVTLHGETQHLPALADYVLGGLLAIAAAWAVMTRRAVWAIAMIVAIMGIELIPTVWDFVQRFGILDIVRLVVNLEASKVFAVVTLTIAHRRGFAGPNRFPCGIVAVLALVTPLIAVITTSDSHGFLAGMVTLIILGSLTAIIDVRIPIAVGAAQATVLASMMAYGSSFLTHPFQTTNGPPWALVYLLSAAAPLIIAMLRTQQPARL